MSDKNIRTEKALPEPREECGRVNFRQRRLRPLSEAETRVFLECAGFAADTEQKQ